MLRDRLDPLHDVMMALVESGHMPGVATLVARGDEVHIDVIGTPSFADPTPLQRDAIFRIASLTKAITAATTMSLIEDGMLSLDLAIDDLVPEMANRRVLRSVDAELDDTVPATRSITVEDLLTSRMGLGSIMAPPGAHPIQRAEDELGLQSIGGPPWRSAHPLETNDWIAALGTLPLLYQPGTQWLYNTSIQVLGFVVARAVGRPLGDVMRERVFEPLGMVDTGFVVPDDKLGRLTTLVSPDPETSELSVLDEPANSQWRDANRFPDASGWLTSTIDDFWAFVSTLVVGGTRGGVRLLSEQSVKLMTTDQLTATQRADAGVFFGLDESWGLGFGATAAGTTGHTLPWGYGWAGGSGTNWRTNPESGVTGILFTQREINSPEPPPAFDAFWTGVNAATVG